MVYKKGFDKVLCPYLIKQLLW